MANRFVTVNDNANIFHDQTTGITIVKGEKKELNDYQLNTKRIRAALQSGHLVYATADEDPIPTISKEEKTATLVKKIQALYKAGTDPKKIEKQFSLEDLKDIATSFEITPEDDDTKSTLVEAIIDEISEKKEGKK